MLLFTCGKRTGRRSGTSSFAISVVSFFRWWGFFTPIAVRSSGVLKNILCFHLFFQFSALFRHLGKSHLNCGKSFLPSSLVGQWDKLVAVCRQSWTPLVIKRPLLSTKHPATATGARRLICNYLFARFANIHRFAISMCFIMCIFITKEITVLLVLW